MSYYSLQSARSGDQPTPTGKAGRVRPRKNEEAHRTPRGKRLAAAKSTDSYLSHANSKNNRTYITPHLCTIP
ncbi:hypothetical protein DQ398_001553 [Rossellomorea marisflavi]|nr:hypothetical protein DQ398_001553 [Rossellomorea marisflavi]